VVNLKLTTMSFVLIISTIVLTIMTIQSNRLQLLIKVIFSCITCYFYVKTLHHGDLQFWADSDFTNENIKILISSGIAFQSIIGFCLSYFLFYGLIKFLLWFVVKNTIEKKINDKIKNISEENKEKIRRVISFMSYKWLRYSVYNQIDENVNTPENMRNIFSMMIHFIVCWFILGIKTNPLTITILLIPIILTFLFIIFMPFRKFLMK
jgi:hypothetical protein